MMKKKFFLVNRLIIIAVLIINLGACSTSAKYELKQKYSEWDSPIVEQQMVSVTEKIDNSVPPADYQVGPNDVIFINVSGKPELGSFLSIGGKLQGSRVDGSGNIHLPVVGSVKVEGMTVEQIRSKIQQVFASYIQDPWVIMVLI